MIVSMWRVVVFNGTTWDFTQQWIYLIFKTLICWTCMVIIAQDAVIVVDLEAIALCGVIIWRCELWGNGDMCIIDGLDLMLHDGRAGLG